MTAIQTDVFGWQGVELSNKWVTLRAVPDIGGRIVSLMLGDYEYVWTNEPLHGQLFTPEEHYGDGSIAAWINYGGDKTWPSPQGWDNDQQWPGPPDPVLDSGRYTLAGLVEGEQGRTVTMVSPPDPVTGLQITRKATLAQGGARITLDLTFTNTADRATRWSIWDVFQHKAGKRAPGGETHQEACAVTVPVNPESRHPRGYNVMFADQDNPQWRVEDGLFVGRFLYRVGKVGLDSMAGWIAFSNSAYEAAFTAQFTPQPGADYPDDGSTVECWTEGRGQIPGLNLPPDGSDLYLMEMEVLSPLYDFAPGQSYNMMIRWGVCRCPGLVIDVTEAGCTSQKLQAERVGESARVTGTFGVFDAGQLALQWLDAAGRVTGEVALGSVDPLGAVVVDRAVAVGEAAAAQLVVTADVDGQVRLLAETSW
jgi:hypothetical protein